MKTNRLYFLDWLRILAFFLLVLYHVGMYYVTWDWHVKSPHASDTIEPLMMLSSPWRMGLLFLISGAAAACLLRKLGRLAFVRQRSARLLVPLLFGMFVIVPPQAYLEVVEKLGYSGGYGDFMDLYVQAYRGFCRGNDCLTLPTWNHLWFLPYLWVYTLLLAALPAAWATHAGAALARWLQGWRLILLPAAFLALGSILLLTSFPHKNNLVWDWHNHATYLPLFLLGALLATQPRFWQAQDKLRLPALATALCCWAGLMAYYSLPESRQQWLNIQRCVYALLQWCALVAACGYAHRHLNFDSPERRYLNQAVFPVYILHQTLIVVLAHNLQIAGLPPMLEGLVLVILTLSASFAVFELVRRLPWLRLPFGLTTSAAPRFDPAQTMSYPGVRH
ncbi:acyltransferase family protein [Massilia sp. erpn]|uniref:acyltransferase family protein n=1 Tax=Massilia sp. erpn TaxID=2738142 RepID=UPI0021058C2C|nr:acyltransferase family protein [Massilia sp. erpn]UTY59040.1 acyltransferase family protein [Massilia sp. erpn]